jgi:hypothetical protein
MPARYIINPCSRSNCMCHCYDITTSLKEVLQQTLARGLTCICLPTAIYSLLSTITKYQSLLEKRLWLYLAVLRQAYRHQEVDDVGFIRSSHNLADCLTKDVQNSALLGVLHTRKLSHPAEEYIKRDKIGTMMRNRTQELTCPSFTAPFGVD